MAAKHQDIPKQYRPGWLESLDGRYGLARELRARFDEVCNDLGGADRLSYMQRSLVERGLWLEYWLAQQEQALSKGGDFDVGKWVQAANSLQGIYSRLGLERRQRDVPDLAQYLAAKAGEAG
ncbi:hypothetical protein ACN2MM_05970 [Alkalilimnicola ehrlichii MLHE-1]|uniref:Uncharacterized protein n=1 Tax=Alkalilimnicola ehrlichii (strain ATCC BAA-1101 / DSM 17681 / MLHE-1) TaxID=187272 RepID=Q0A9S1_ALKEH|nr:hypothetical protein [Alkalilimnicola ehrlichii]ABI56416.1 hypothetical protein Mlg_1064 [Alkalilimnicola ehrlichii MLHE-1]